MNEITQKMSNLYFNDEFKHNSRRLNVIIFGLNNSTDDSDLEIVKNLFSKMLSLDNNYYRSIKIISLYRTRSGNQPINPSQSPNKPDPLIVTLSSKKDRDFLVKCSRKFKIPGIFINPDLAPYKREQLKKLSSYCKQLNLQSPDENFRHFISGDKIIGKFFRKTQQNKS
jgi:hypothetical protein